MRPRVLPAVLAVALAATFAACDFEQVIDLDVPPYEPRLVLGGFPTPDNIFSVRVGRSTSALTPSNLDPHELTVTDARIALFDESGAFIDSLAPCLTCDSAPGLYLSVQGIHPESGQAYTLRAEVPGLPPVEATTRLPEPPSFSVRNEGVVNETPDRGRTVRLVVTLPDPPGTQTYDLRILRFMESEDGPSYVQSLMFTSNDQALREDFDRLDVAVDIDVDPEARTFYGHALFRDLSFAGTTHEVPLDVSLFDEGPNDDAPITVILSALDDDYVRYQQTLALQDETGDNPFAEPVRIHSNVEGGLGVFAGYASSTVTLEIE